MYVHITNMASQPRYNCNLAKQVYWVGIQTFVSNRGPWPSEGSNWYHPTHTVYPHT